MHKTAANGQAKTHGRNGRVIPNGTPAVPPLSPVKTAPPPAGGQGDAQPADGQDPATGRFLPGNKCAKGNSHYRRAAALRSAFASAVTEDEIKALARQLFKQAKAGDTTAAGLLLSYAVGKPGPAPDPDRCDLDEFGLLRDRPGKGEALLLLVDSADPAAVVRAARLSDLADQGQSPEEFLRLLADRYFTPNVAGEFQAERAARRRRR
jgi:hypothetical protein